jgi:hypothetical protein
MTADAVNPAPPSRSRRQLYGLASAEIALGVLAVAESVRQIAQRSADGGQGATIGVYPWTLAAIAAAALLLGSGVAVAARRQSGRRGSWAVCAALAVASVGLVVVGVQALIGAGLALVSPVMLGADRPPAFLLGLSVLCWIGAAAAALAAQRLKGLLHQTASLFRPPSAVDIVWWSAVVAVTVVVALQPVP